MKPRFVAASTSAAWLNSLPEIVKLQVIEERRDVHDLAVPHLHKPRVAVAVGLAIGGGRLDIKERDEHVTVGTEASQFDTRGLVSRASPYPGLITAVVFLRRE